MTGYGMCREDRPSAGLQKSLEQLQVHLARLSLHLDSVIFRDVWKGAATGINRLIYNKLVTECQFSPQVAPFPLAWLDARCLTPCDLLSFLNSTSPSILGQGVCTRGSTSCLSTAEDTHAPMIGKLQISCSPPPIFSCRHHIPIPIAAAKL